MNKMIYHVGQNVEGRPFKGQWFLISAVIASSIFLAISFLLRDYFSVPPAIGNDEQIYFDDVKNGAIRAVKIDCEKQGGGNLNNRENLTDYIYFAGQRMAALGYLLNITAKNTIDCTKGIENFHVILLKSNKADVWEGSRPEINIIDNIMFSGGKLASYRIKFVNAMGYDFSVNASIYNAAGFVNSKIQGVPSGSGEITIDFGVLNIPDSRPNMYTIVNSIHITGKTRWELL